MSSDKEFVLREEIGYVDFEVYGYTVYIVFTNDLQKSRDRYTKAIGHSGYVPETAGAIHASTISNRAYLFFRWDAGPETIAHESWHAIRRLMEFIGATHENEIMAYHIGHLVGCIHSLLKHLKKERLHIHDDRAVGSQASKRGAWRAGTPESPAAAQGTKKRAINI